LVENSNEEMGFGEESWEEISGTPLEMLESRE
jgi:hypothetical protein